MADRCAIHGDDDDFIASPQAPKKGRKEFITIIYNYHNYLGFFTLLSFWIFWGLRKSHDIPILVVLPCFIMFHGIYPGEDNGFYFPNMLSNSYYA